MPIVIGEGRAVVSQGGIVSNDEFPDSKVIFKGITTFLRSNNKVEEKFQGRFIESFTEKYLVINILEAFCSA